MMPPFVRRCPACRHLTWSSRFAAVGEVGSNRVACPACGHQFPVTDAPWLQ